MKTEVNENNIPLEKIEEDFLTRKKINLYVLREDLIHSEISGNKWRKLKYNIEEAKKRGHHQLLTFGGAYSNHIAATAAAGKIFGFKTIGIIRGEETLPLNSTLQLVKENGMILKYVSREQYNNKYEESFLKDLKNELGEFYEIPEGGSNSFAVKGCTEIITNINIEYDAICCACGTGGTIAGIIASVSSDKKVFGFPALKGGAFLKEDIQQLLWDYSNRYTTNIINKDWELTTGYHFGGFAKIKPELIDFIRGFKKKHNILLDFIYTGKLVFGLYEMIKNANQFDNKTIILVHTGGTQGNKGFEERLNVTI